MYRRFYANEEAVDEVISYLREYLAVKTHLMAENPGLSSLDQTVELDKTLTRFEQDVKSGRKDPEPNEELESIDKLIDEIRSTMNWGFGYDSREAVLRSYFERMDNHKQVAYGVFARLADDMRIRMLAMEFMLRSVLNSATHREKDTKLGMVLDMVNSIIEDIAQIDKADPERYRWSSNRSGSWDYVQALADLHYRKSQIDALEKKNLELSEKLERYEYQEQEKKDGQEEFVF